MSVFSTLKQHTADGLLVLAADVFPGPVATAINDYLNGISLTLGDEVTLTVAADAGAITLQATPVTLTASPTGDGATVTISDAGASVTLTFTKGDSDVTLDAAIASGSVSWFASDIWPSELDGTLFKSVSLSDVALALSTTSSSDSASIDFNGSADFSYKQQTMVTATVEFLAGGDTSDNGTGAPSFLAAATVSDWSPGSIWSALSDVTLSQAGIIFSSIDGDNSMLSSLLDGDAVPAVNDPNFILQTGLSFFATLGLQTGSVSVLSDFLPTQLSLYANLATDDSTFSILASIGEFTKGSFTFSGLQLSWTEDDGTTNIVLSSGGTLTLGEESLSFTASADISVSDTAENCTLSLSVDEWEQPFGYRNLEVCDFEVDITLGTDGGVTAALGGQFRFGNDEDGHFDCIIGGAITEFEDPSALVFDLSSPANENLTLGLIIEEITTVDFQSCPVIHVIDEVFQFSDLGFWVVEVPSVQIGGKTYDQGFGIAADFTIYGEKVTLNIDVEEQGAGTPSFSATATLSKPLVFGSTLTLSGALDTNVGPDLNVYSSGDPDYFYVDAEVVFLDVIQTSLYGTATSTGFKFIYDIQAGQQSDQGVWLQDTIAILLNTSQLIFEASTAFQFTSKNVSLGPLVVDGFTVVPQTTQDMDVSVQLTFDADLEAGTLALSGEIRFDFMSQAWNPAFSLSLDLASAVAKWEDIGDQVATWLKDNSETVFAALKTNAGVFAAFIKANFSLFVSDVRSIAQVLKDTFGKGEDDAVSILNDIGFDATSIIDALVSVFDLTLDAAEDLVDKILGQDCSVSSAADLLFNTSSSTLSKNIELSVSTVAGPLLYDLQATQDGQTLLLHLHKHRRELDAILTVNSTVQSVVRSEIGKAAETRFHSRAARKRFNTEAVERVLRTLRIVADAGSPGLKKSIEAISVILTKHQHSSSTVFLEPLRMKSQKKAQP